MLVIVKKFADISKTGRNLANVDAIIDSVRNILFTRVGEVPFNREFGSFLENYLFDEFSFSTSRSILAEVTNSISRWEPRVSVAPETEVVMDQDKREYRLFLALKIEGFTDEIFIEETLKPKEAA